MIHVIAVITAKPGMRQAILDELQPRIPEVLEEEGCVEYIPTTDAANVDARIHSPTLFGPDTFVVFEKWKSMQALQHHSQMPFVLDYLKIVGPMIASRVVHIMDSVA